MTSRFTLYFAILLLFAPLANITNSNGEKHLGITTEEPTRYDSTAADSVFDSDTWLLNAGGSGDDMVWDMTLTSNGEMVVTGSFTGTVDFGTHSLTATSGLDAFVAKADADGNWLWASSAQGAYNEWGTAVTTDASGDIYVTGLFIDESGAASPSITIGGKSLSAHPSSTYDLFVAKLNSGGNWQWAETSKKIDFNQGAGDEFASVLPWDIVVDDFSVTIAGTYAGSLWAYDDTGDKFFMQSNSADIYLGFLSHSGVWDSQSGWGGSGSDSAYALALASDGSGDWFVGGTYQNSVDFLGLATHTSSAGSTDLWLMKISSSGVPIWVVEAGGGGSDTLRAISTSTSGSVFITGDFDGVLADYGGTQLTASGGGADVFAARLTVGGLWDWARRGGGTNDDFGFDLVLSTDESNLLIAGTLTNNAEFESGSDLFTVSTSGASDGFVAFITVDGSWSNITVMGGPSGGDRVWAVKIDANDTIHLAGRFKGGTSNPALFGGQNLTSLGGYDIFAWKARLPDADSDGFADDDDACATVFGNSTSDRLGCPDRDGDGWSDDGDDLPDELSQWNDSDSDGFGDNPSGNNADDCLTAPGNSTEDRLGCPDLDGDGWSDIGDDLPNNPTQHLDSDDDGFGDNPNGTFADDCPAYSGPATMDALGCPDSDADGVSDKTDAFINNPTQTTDRDGDGWGDNQSENATMIDRLPDEWSQHTDADGDGFGDDPDGNFSDSFTNDSTQWNDTDGDGFGDNQNGTTPDSCPDDAGDSIADRYGCQDSDGDGWSDESDDFPNEWSQWHDSDGDGLGDNWVDMMWNETRKPHWPGEYIVGAKSPDPSPLDSDNDGFEDESLNSSTSEIGNSIAPFDDCPNIFGTSNANLTGCIDTDNDGFADSEDAFRNEISQWLNEDGDLYGSNSTGFEADNCPSIAGTSKIDRLGCPDTDGDGYSDPMGAADSYPWTAEDGADLYPNDPERWNRSTSAPSTDSNAGLGLGLGIGAMMALAVAGVIIVFALRKEDDVFEDEDELVEIGESNTDSGSDIVPIVEPIQIQNGDSALDVGNHTNNDSQMQLSNGNTMSAEDALALMVDSAESENQDELEESKSD
jgi:hypothetical protein